MSEAIPSREKILAVLAHETLTSSQLRGRFEIGKKHKLSFKAMLSALVEEGLLVRNGKKEYLPAKTDSSGKPVVPVYDGQPTSRRHQKELVDTSNRIRKGILVQDEEGFAVRDSETQKLFNIPNRNRMPAKEGQNVVFELYPHPKRRYEMLAKIIASAQDYGTFDQLKLDFHHRFELPESFPEAVENEIKDMREPAEGDYAGREDYRNLTIICIDPLGARDHDDAISVEKTAKGYRLGVHIADVSHYVKEDGPLDNEAIERSFTQYLPWCAVPMLPEKLSADLCSLMEGVDRFAFTCMMELDEKAKVKSYEFKRSVIKVTRSITYEEAMEQYEKKDQDLMLLREVTRLLKDDRIRSGLLELGSVEYKVDFDDKKEPIGISPRSNVESNSWVEECMLIANQCCAKELDKRELHGIFRIHEAPDLADIIELAQAEPELVRGAPVNIKDLPPSKQGDSNLSPQIFALYQYMVEKARGFDPKIFKILRSMQKAHYDSNSFGHFALNWQDYAHFTSPIRRYADLWCHRELARTGKEIKAKRKHDVAEIANLISANEIKNQKCERSALKVCTAWMLRERVGDIFKGTISGMEEWGLFVTLDDPSADGLVRYRDLPGEDFWFFHRERNCVIGRRSRRSFHRGDRVEVQLLRVNPTKGEIDLSVLDKLNEVSAIPKESRVDPIVQFAAERRSKNAVNNEIHSAGNSKGKPNRPERAERSDRFEKGRKPAREERSPLNKGAPLASAARGPVESKKPVKNAEFLNDFTGTKSVRRPKSSKGPKKPVNKGPNTFTPPKSAGKPRRGKK